MAINFDENLLLKKRIDPDFDEPIANQLLRIAIFDEYQAYEFYNQVINKFGPIAPFAQIAEAEKRHYKLLEHLLIQYQVELPNHDGHKMVLPDTIMECYELAVAREINNIAMYTHLLSHTQQADIQDAFFRLQAASYNNHLPAFRQAVASQNAFDSIVTENQGYQAQAAYANDPNVNQNTEAGATTPSPEELAGKMDEFKHLIQSVMSGNVDQAELGKFLQNSNLALIGGLLAGSFGTMLINNLNKKNKTDEQEATTSEENPSVSEEQV